MFEDPVCKKELSEAEVKAKFTYDRSTYHFCSVQCQELFVADPAQYNGGGALWSRFRNLFAAPGKASAG